MWQKRGPALLCLLLATALTVFAAARSPAAPPGEVPPPQTLEEESLLYEETPVQIISLLDLEPVDTRASANPVRVGGGTLAPVDQAEMASVLAECTLKDNTIRLNAIQAGIDGWVALKDPAIDIDLKLNTNDIGFKEILSLIPNKYHELVKLWIGLALI